jgi:hypothetical protein
MSDDDTSRNRLTTGHPENGSVYLDATVEMYRDLLGSVGHEASPACRRELRLRLANAFWRLFKIDLADRRIGSATSHLASFIHTSPRAFLYKVAGLKPGRMPAHSSN